MQMTEERWKKLHLELNAIAHNLVEMDPEDAKKLSQGMKNVPVSQMMDQVTYMQEVILPRIREKEGIDGANYKFYKGVHDSLLWAILVVDRYNTLQWWHTQLKLMESYQRERATLAESELQKYYTLEDLTLSSNLNTFAKAIAARANDILHPKPEKKP